MLQLANTLLFFKNKKGFTIVELLIVVVIIAILAGVVILSYNGVRARAIDSSMQSDLRDSQATLKTEVASNSKFPATPSVLKASNGAQYQYTYDNTTSPATFCLTTTADKRSFFINQFGNPTKGACPGHADGGVADEINWSQTNSISTNWYAGAMSTDAKTIVTGQYNTSLIYRSTNGGATWATVPSGTGQWHSFAGTPDGSTFYAMKLQGGISRSVDGGATWTTVTPPPSSAPAWHDIQTSADTSVIAVRNSQGVFVSTTNGADWISAAALPSGSAIDIALADNGMSLYAINAAGLAYRSTTNGTSWTALPTMNTSVNDSHIETSDDGLRLFTLGNATLKVSTNSGATSTTRTLPNAAVKGELKASADGSRLIARDIPLGNIYTSNDTGTTWVQSSLGSAPWYGLQVTSDGNHFLALRYSQPVYKGSF